MTLCYQAIRWRRKIWGEIPPTSVDLDRVRTLLAECEEIHKNPQYVKWSKLPMAKLAQELSFPTWMIEQWVHDQGLEPAVNLALALNQPADTYLRANTLKTDRDQLQKILQAEGVETKPTLYSPWGLHLLQRFNLHATKAFSQGLFEIQDEGSQLTALMSDVQPNSLVIDACARTGGKSLALASLMENRGTLVACDIDARVFDELHKRAARAGVTIAQTQWVGKDDPNPLAKYKDKADLVFVDAPCSGLGTLRRKSWTKWTLNEGILKEMHEVQVDVISKYSQYVKPGGELIYVTCSINSWENEKVVKRFLDKFNVQFTVEATKTFRPDVEGTDGFFVTKFKRS